MENERNRVGLQWPRRRSHSGPRSATSPPSTDEVENYRPNFRAGRRERDPRWTPRPRPATSSSPSPPKPTQPPRPYVTRNTGSSARQQWAPTTVIPRGPAIWRAWPKVSIRASNLPSTTNTYDIYRHFSAFGEIEYIKFLNRNNTVALIKFR